MIPLGHLLALGDRRFVGRQMRALLCGCAPRHEVERCGEAWGVSSG